MPHHWTKIGDPTAAKGSDAVYQDEETQTFFVLGNAGNKSKAEIASDYNVSEQDVVVLQKRK